MNKVILMGRLTRDPEVRQTANTNTQVATFSLAVNRRFKTEGQPDADFINIVAWNKTAEFCGKYFRKGQQVGVIGRIQTRNYEDKEGKRVYVTEVVAEEVYFADTKRDANSFEDGFNSSVQPAMPETSGGFMEIEEDPNLPF